MKFITRILQQKYQIFNNILFEERKELFCSHTYCRNNANYDYLLEMVLGREAIDPDNKENKNTPASLRCFLKV